MNRRVVRQERIEVDGIVAEVAYKRVRRLTLRVKSSDGPGADDGTQPRIAADGKRVFAEADSLDTEAAATA